ncbi:MAG: signal peptidase I [Lachnospiraceae bacterium]
MQKNKKSGVVISILGILVCCIFGILLLFNLIIIVKGVINPETPPSVFGITPLVVQSGSMSGNADDHIEVGDLILVRKTDTSSLREGDVISFMEEKTVITHRITKISKDENGALLFTTKGDANNVEDANPVPEKNVLGKFNTRLPGFGDFAMFLQSAPGMLLFIGVPLCLLIVLDLIFKRKASKEESEKTTELEQEVERLRALAAEAEKKTRAAEEKTGADEKSEAEDEKSEEDDAKPEAEDEKSVAEDEKSEADKETVAEEK